MADSTTTEPGAPSAAPGGGMQAVLDHMKSDKLEAALWFCRLLNMTFTFLYLVPLVGNPYTHYQRALMSGAAISAFRLHMRMPQIQLSRAFIAGLVREDSFHYLIFCVTFLTFTGPVTIALAPVFLFSMLHVTKYTGILLNCLGPQSLPPLRAILTKVDGLQRTLLRFIACSEIFLMPTCILIVFSGQGALFLPFVYYQFLCMRYTSLRNPYSRQLFAELRFALDQLCQSPSCPSLVTSIIQKVMALVMRTAPAVPTS